MVTLGERLEGAGPKDIWARASQVESTSSAEAWRQECGAVTASVKSGQQDRGGHTGRGRVMRSERKLGSLKASCKAKEVWSLEAAQIRCEASKRRGVT